MTQLAQLDFTTLDFDDLLAQLIARVPSVAGDRWTDLGDSDLGRSLLELFTSVNTAQILRLDMTANELYLATARQRGSVIKLTELIGYAVSGNVSSTAALRYSIGASHTQDIPIPVFTRASTTGDPTLDFYNFGAATLTAGLTFVDVTVSQGIRVTENFTATGAEDFEVILANADVGQNAIQLTVSSVIWSEVTNFLNSGNTAEDYTARFNEDEKMVIRFGDGSFGKIPPAAANITINYLRSAGADGNVGSATITKLQVILDDILGSPQTLSVSNAAPAIGGGNKETIESVKINAPASLSAVNRAVTKKDYITLIEAVDGVARANSWGESEESPPNVSLFNKVRMTFSPNGGGTPTAQLRTNVLNKIEGGGGLDATSMVIVRHELRDPIYLSVPVTATVNLVQGFVSSTVQSAIQVVLTDFFSLTEREFDEDVRISQVSQLISDVSGVNFLTLALAQPGRLVGDGSEPFDVTVAVDDTFDVAIDGGGTLSITLTAGTARTAQNVVDDLNGDGPFAAAATASVVGENQILIISDTTGTVSEVNVKTGNANTLLGFADNADDLGTSIVDVPVNKQEIAILGTVTLTMVVP